MTPLTSISASAVMVYRARPAAATAACFIGPVFSSSAVFTSFITAATCGTSCICPSSIARVLCSRRSVAMMLRPSSVLSATMPMTLRVPISRAKICSLEEAAFFGAAFLTTLFLAVLVPEARRLVVFCALSAASAVTFVLGIIVLLYRSILDS